MIWFSRWALTLAEWGPFLYPEGMEVNIIAYRNLYEHFEKAEGTGDYQIDQINNVRVDSENSLSVQLVSVDLGDLEFVILGPEVALHSVRTYGSTFDAGIAQAIFKALTAGIWAASKEIARDGAE